MASLMEKRQGVVNNDNIYNDDDAWWWYSSTAAAIKWAVIALIFLLLLAWFVGGYYHAQRRMRKGLAPLAYHRWLLPRSQRARYEPRFSDPQNQFSFYQAHGGYGNNYGMHAVPPPAYNPHQPPPPSYEPPAGASKINPLQSDYAQPSVGESSNTSHGNARAADSTPTLGSRNPFRQ